MLPAPHPFRHGGPFSLILSYLWPGPSDTRILVIAPHPAALSAIGALPFSVQLCRLHHLSLSVHHHTPLSLLRTIFQFQPPSFPPRKSCVRQNSSRRLLAVFSLIRSYNSLLHFIDSCPSTPSGQPSCECCIWITPCPLPVAIGSVPNSSLDDLLAA